MIYAWLLPRWLREILARLERIEHKLDVLSARGRHHMEEDFKMKEHLEELRKAVAENTDVMQSAKAALEGFVGTVAELTQKLQDAIAHDDVAAVKEITAELAANTDALREAIPEIAEAVEEHTQPEEEDKEEA